MKEYQPVANRTRRRKAIQMKKDLETIKKARKKAMKEWKETNNAVQFSGPNHGDEESDDDIVVELDRDKFESLCGSKRNFREKDLGFTEIDNVGTSDMDGEEKSDEKFRHDFEENNNFFMGHNENEDESDSSCKVTGERFNCIENFSDDDLVESSVGMDDGEKGDNSGQKKSMASDQGEGSDSESSSEDEEDDSEDDRDFKTNEPESSSSSFVSESSGGFIEEFQEEIHVKGGDKSLELEKKQENKDVKRRGKKKNSEFLRHFDGLQLPSNPLPKGTPLKPIVDRTRSHSKPQLPSKNGFSSYDPVVLEDTSSTEDEHGDDFHRDEDDKRGENRLSRPVTPNSGHHLNNGDDCHVDEDDKRVESGVLKPVNQSSNRKRERPPKEMDGELPPPSKKKKKKRGFKDNELQKILINTMTENGDTNLDEFMLSVREFDFCLPLKFKFGVEKMIYEEKSEEDQELEELWKELDFALGACNIGVDDNCGDYKNEDFVPSDSAVLQEKLCAEGKHHLVVDEEIGIICKFCSFVRLEIKHLTADFNKNPFGKGGNRDYGRFVGNHGGSPLDGFQFHDNSYDSQAGHTTSDGTWDTVWDLIPGTKRCLYPHQQEGFEFIWRNVAGGIKISELGKPPTNSSLGGCIICHAPGTGKTRLSVVFLQSYIKQYPSSRPIIIAPCSVLFTWEDEFKQWKATDVPFLNMNRSDLSGEEDLRLQSILRNTKDKKTIRLAKLCTWMNGRGVLGISYSLFEQLTSEGKNADDKLREVLFNKTGIIVLDEGHTPRNDGSLILKALLNVATRKKIILSGTPFQNNFNELNNTISLVREEFVDPLLADCGRDYSRKCGRNYAPDRRKGPLMRFMNRNVDEGKKLEVLRTRIKPFVHVYKGGILKETLRGLLKSVLVLNPSDLQRRCLEHLPMLKSTLELDYLVSVASVHPSILEKCQNIPESLDEGIKAALRKSKLDLDAGVKTRFLFELIKLSKGEKVLVFSQYLKPLNFIGGLLNFHFNWTEGREILYMDGKHEAKQRQNFIRVFNDPRSEARVLLASTKACCEGIHLVGASRVVLLDVVWNPSVERQAISRAYRLGQDKNVHVYHLLTSGTMEFEKYCRKESKDRLSELVFSASEHENFQAAVKSTVSEDRVLDEMISHEKTKPIFERIIYEPKADDLIDSFELIERICH